jgi:hypothetical protein
MIGAARKLAVPRTALATLLAFCVFCCTAGSGASPSVARPSSVLGMPFVGSVDTMKLSRDQAGSLSTGEINRVVDLLTGSMSTTHVSVDTPLEQPAVIEQWANRIHADGKHVWFRLISTTCDQPHGDLGDGYPSYAHGYLTELHELIRSHPGVFRAGDILDGDPEAENGCWWAHHYGCGVQSSCTPCGDPNPVLPCAPIAQFNAFLANMTSQENRDLQAMGIGGVATNVHSTDPGTAKDVLTPNLVSSMGNLVTLDAYPDQRTSSPSAAAGAWRHELSSLRKAWLRRGLNVSILVGEWGYCLAINVDDATQQSVLKAEVRALRRARYLVGTNYWVGPGTASDGGFTQILQPQGTEEWRFRPAAGVISSFYAAMALRAPVGASSSPRLSASPARRGR